MPGKMLGKFFSRWFKKEDGATAIEFALMSVPYIFLTAAILEMSIMYASASLLEGATGSAARLIRTGELQTSEEGDPQDLFRTAICNYATVLINCNDVVIEVVPMDNFSDYDSMQPQFDSDGNLVSQGFDAGESETKIMVRVAYRYTMMTPLIGPLLAGADNSRLFMSTIILQNEPYVEED